MAKQKNCEESAGFKKKKKTHMFKFKQCLFQSGVEDLRGYRASSAQPHSIQLRLVLDTGVHFKNFSDGHCRVCRWRQGEFHP